MSTDAVLERYFREAASWDADRQALHVRNALIAWWVAGTAGVVALCLGLALLTLVPLKRVEPFVIRVDNATGVVDVVPTYVGGAPLDETVTRYFLTHYVTVCERFSFATAESDYEECGAFHGPQRNQAWLELWTRGNPASPLNVYKDGSTVRAQVESVSFFTRADGIKDLAQVRYRKSQKQGTAAEKATHWIATIHYAYTTPPRDPRLRRWNPLGFKVIDFRPEPETLAPSAEGGRKSSAGDPSRVGAGAGL